MIQSFLEIAQPYLLPVLYGVVIVALVPLVDGYIVLMERKVMADMQARLGPMRVGPHGLLQPIADGVKLMLKEDIIPESADKWIFWFAPVVSVTTAMVAMSPLAIGPVFQIADLNIGLLFVLGVSSMGIYGVVMGGWASNSHYSLLGALRSSAQLVSYETAGGLAVISGLLFAGTLSMRGIVEWQAQHGVWIVILTPIAFFIYLVASIAETNRAPFDMPEAESELVAGYMTEYSGFRWALYLGLAETTNMIVVGSIATTLFLGGWLRPFSGTHALDFLDWFPALLMLVTAAYCFYRTPKQPVAIQKLVLAAFGLLFIALAGVLGISQTAPGAWLKPGVHGAFWFMAKVLAYIYTFMWLRFTFPRYRFDQLMKLGWHFLIPTAIVNVMSVGTALALYRQFGWSHFGLAAALGVTTLITLLVAGYLAYVGEQRTPAAEMAERA
jgi:NADH-quinone oxidoreductase subunit H